MVLTPRVAIWNTRGPHFLAQNMQQIYCIFWATIEDVCYSGVQPLVSGPSTGAGLSTKSVLLAMHGKHYRNDLSDSDNMLGHKNEKFVYSSLELQVINSEYW